jgi:TrmH family RNA methyltransferase
MGAVFTQPLVKAEATDTPGPRAALVAHGGDPLEALGSPATLCLGSERDGLPADVIAACETRVTIPLRPGAESLNVAAAAAIALQRISSPAPGTMGTEGDGEGHE